MLVKIKPDTIVPNPRAGQTNTQVMGSWEGSFKVKGIGAISVKYIIEKLELIPGIEFTSWSDDFAEGVAMSPESLMTLNYQGSLYENFEIGIHSKNNWECVYHNPLPQYLYEYENPKIECNNCGHAIFVLELDSDTDDDGCRFTVCPVCKGINTYEEIEYQNIKDVVQ